MKKKLEVINLLFIGQFLFLFLTLIIESLKGEIYLKELLLFTGCFFLFFKLMRKALKMFYYSYWTFSIILLFYSLNGLWKNLRVGGHDDLLIIYFFSFFIICLLSYILSSPIFYPRVNWWEYDFRYREDWPIKIKKEELYLEGRLTDLRRGAGCVVLFHDLCIGDELTIYKEGGLRPLKLCGEIVSKREYLYGRGITYGVHFLFKDSFERKIFNKIIFDWEQNRKEKKQMRFEEKSGEKFEV